MRQLNRIHPAIGPENFVTYELRAPIGTHRRRASCAEVECIRRLRGFRAQFDVSTPQGRANARTVDLSSRRYVREVAGSLVTYTFAAGQDCFTAHTVPLEREPMYLVRGGDYRGNPRRTRTHVHARPELWVEQFAEHQDALAGVKQRG